ncbi:MAG: hypothetical protein MZW92_44030 [Comamonadaceae bacterium]|nr:hypothetical protein [Comamonadaceae bacterium]
MQVPHEVHPPNHTFRYRRRARGRQRRQAGDGALIERGRYIAPYRRLQRLSHRRLRHERRPGARAGLADRRRRRLARPLGRDLPDQPASEHGGDGRAASWLESARARTARRRPMPWFALRDMADEDLRALFRFVRALGFLPDNPHRHTCRPARNRPASPSSSPRRPRPVEAGMRLRGACRAARTAGSSFRRTARMAIVPESWTKRAPLLDAAQAAFLGSGLSIEKRRRMPARRAAQPCPRHRPAGYRPTAAR